MRRFPAVSNARVRSQQLPAGKSIRAKKEHRPKRYACNTVPKKVRSSSYAEKLNQEDFYELSTQWAQAELPNEPFWTIRTEWPREAYVLQQELDLLKQVEGVVASVRFPAENASEYVIVPHHGRAGPGLRLKSDKARGPVAKMESPVPAQACPAQRRGGRFSVELRIAAWAIPWLRQGACANTDRWMLSFSFWIPRRYRQAIMGDLIEDREDMRSLGKSEWRIRAHVVWQIAISALSLWPAAAKGVLFGTLLAKLRQWIN
jgi:hypothetical protein